MPKGFVVLIFGLITILFIGIVLWAYRVPTAPLITNAATLVWMLGVMAWVVVRDSRKRWPEASTWERYVNVITFKR
jgi:hypothetical protein